MRHLVNYSFHVTRGRMAHLQQTTVTGQKGKEFGLGLLLKKNYQHFRSFGRGNNYDVIS